MDRQKMKNVTIALPDIYVENLEKLQKVGMIPSRSEGLRLAIREFLKKEFHVAKLMGLKEDQETGEKYG